MNINKYRLKLAVLFLLIGIAFSAFGQNKNPSSPITRKGYDFRTKGHDSGRYYIVRISLAEPVVIAVATDDKTFIEEMKSLIRDMDDKGYENITLLLYDLDPENIKETHSIIFLQNGAVVGAIKGYDDQSWTLLQVKNSKTTSGVKLSVQGSEYPLDVIKTKIRTTHDGSSPPKDVTGH